MDLQADINVLKAENIELRADNINTVKDIEILKQNQKQAVESVVTIQRNVSPKFVEQ